eukprot:GHVU01061084.1.p2 GENE.GHVU01061084.1~~GHVU01061084.1.p2  ORF type:complete len:135 (-),score=7.24 GHVU01061084.1:1370-1774(-)
MCWPPEDEGQGVPNNNRYIVKWSIGPILSRGRLGRARTRRHGQYDIPSRDESPVTRENDERASKQVGNQGLGVRVVADCVRACVHASALSMLHRQYIRQNVEPSSHLKRHHVYQGAADSTAAAPPAFTAPFHVP